MNQAPKDNALDPVVLAQEYEETIYFYGRRVTLYVGDLIGVPKQVPSQMEIDIAFEVMFRLQREGLCELGLELKGGTFDVDESETQSWERFSEYFREDPLGTGWWFSVFIRLTPAGDIEADRRIS